MELRLIVLRTDNIQILADFYSLLGLQFQYHQHGNSAFHFSTVIGKTVLEIYPLTKSQTVADKNIRLGFEVDNFDDTVYLLKQQHTTFITEPAATDFGFMAVIEDPDGRKIELYKP